MANLKGKPKGGDDLVEWFTVSYRTIIVVAGLVLLLLGAAIYFYFFAGRPAAPGPAPSAAPVVVSARFTSIEGSVRVKAVGTFEWVPADRHMVLSRGDLVQTRGGAAAEITFVDGTTVQMRPDSLLSIEEAGEQHVRGQRRVAVGLSSGDVSYNRSRADGSTQVSTPTLTLTQDNAGRGDLRVAESGETDVRIFSGSGARLETRQGTQLTLAPSEAVRVDAAGKPGQRLSLPEAPQLQAPSHQTEISYPDPGRGTTLLLWKEVAGAVEYHVMVDFSPGFSRPLVDQRIRETQVALRGLEPGRYFWRVAAVTKEGAEGGFSESARFQIARAGAGGAAAPPPPLALDSLEVRNNILQVKGRSEPGASVTVNGQPVEVQPDGTFNEFVTLRQAGSQVVEIRAVGLNGGVRVVRQSVVVAGL